MSVDVERRKYIRRKTHIPVSISRLKGGISSKDSDSITRNMSEGGICFRAPNFIPMACRIVFELDMPAFSDPVKIVSRVAWIDKTASGEDYEIGAQFLDMSREDKELLMKYIASLEG
ncbi:MAG: PilZ domain-containing protein [Candidatus Omnitrophica bacterium]|nr:PilZ domain-containing protein [Candidatus Omnitrophota bacterium]